MTTPYLKALIDALDILYANMAEALLVERQAIASEARRYAEMYSESSDGRHTFLILADWIEARAALASETERC